MNKRNVVVQDYQLVNAKYKLSMSELKFILIAIAQIKQEDTEFIEYEIKVSELEEKLQKEQNETRLKQFAKKLLSKPLEVPTEDGWLVANWFSDIEYIRGHAKFKVSISNKLRPYLLQLKDKFVKYNLQYILPLNSSYSIRIYQLLKEFKDTNRAKRTFTVEELQDLLQVTKSYKERYNKFKTGILQVAQKELKEHSDIYFDFKEEKEGKRVNEIVFKIRSKFDDAVIKKQAPQLFEVELSEQQEQLKQYIGKYILGKDKILSFNVVDHAIIVTTPAGDYRFLNIEALVDNIQDKKKG